MVTSKLAERIWREAQKNDARHSIVVRELVCTRPSFVVGGQRRCAIKHRNLVKVILENPYIAPYSRTHNA
jgi:hypothetical protein